ncbi:MAG: beta-propeller fold lactonase family protein [Bacteroidota bacterium]
MRSRLNFFIALLIGLIGMSTSSYGQLYYEGLMFEGSEQALLSSATSSAVSPDGKHVYTVSSTSNAVTTFSRNETTGNLTFVNSFTNGEQGVSGISGANDIVVSPDGQQVYVAGTNDDAIAVFNRNAVDGQLTFVHSLVNNSDGLSSFEEPEFIAVSPDGNHIYVTAMTSHAVVVFSRNITTGYLNVVETHTDDNNGINNMAAPLGVCVSPDGKNVYVASFDESAVNIFERNTDSGMLTFKADRVDGISGIDGLSGAYDIIVSGDNENVYVTGSFDNALVNFNRNTSNGNLTFAAQYVDNQNGVDGLSGAVAVMMTPDGSAVCVSGPTENAIAVFTRDTGSGALNFSSTLKDGANGISDMQYPIDISISNDGDNLYATSIASNAVVTFDISSTSILTYKNTQVVNDFLVNGLTGVEDMAISGDNKHLYTAANEDDGIGIFERDAVTGELSFVDIVLDGVNGVNSLNGVNGVSVSPDGQNVYVTAFWEHSISVFDRNATTGELTYREVHRDGLNGVDGLNGSNNVTVSQNGNNVYASAFWEHSVSVFSRNASTGALTYLQALENGQDGVDGIIRPSCITESPDQKHLYVTGSFSNAVAIFERNAITGMLTYIGVVKDGQNGVDGLRGANYVSLSPDGSSVYIAGKTDNAVAVFSRDANTGLLTFVQVLKNGIDNVGGIDGVSDVKVSPDGNRVYTSSEDENSSVIFNRDPATGMLTFEMMQTDNMNSVNGIQGSESLVLDASGRYIYVSGGSENSIGVFSCTYEYIASEVICSGQSITVAGKDYTSSGHYEEIIDQGNCRTIVDLDLEVVPTNFTFNKAICQGSSYTFDGTSYTTAGQYTGNFTSSIGCDSVVTLNLDVVTEFETTMMNEEICEGESIEMGGMTYSTSGSFTNTFTSTGGCDSTVVLNLNVNANKDVTMEASICAGEFYTFGNSNYINTGTYTRTFSAASGCDSVVTLNLTVVEENAIFNETICAGETYMLDGTPYTTGGSYNASITTTSGCNADVTLNLTVLPVADVTLNEAICSGSSFEMGGSSYNTSGTFNTTLTSSTGCDSVVTLNLTVVENNITLDETICEGGSYTVGGTTYSTTGTYTEVMTSQVGCGDSTVTLNLTVVPTTSLEQVSICEGESYELNGNTFTTSGTYTAMITGANGCMTTVTLELDVAPSFNVDQFAAICEGETYTVGSETFATSGSYTVNMFANGGCDSIVNLELVVNEPISANVSATICEGETYTLGNNVISQAGIYSETLSSTATGCDSTVNLVLTVIPNIEVIGIVNDDDGNNTGSIELNISIGTPPYTFEWSNGATTQTIGGLASGTYTVVVTNGNGCSRTYTYEVKLGTATGDLERIGLLVNVLTNPVAIGQPAELIFNSSDNHRLQLQLYNLSGQLLGSEQVVVGTGRSSHRLVAPPTAGLYLIRLTNEDGKSEVLRLAVQ